MRRKVVFAASTLFAIFLSKSATIASLEKKNVKKNDQKFDGRRQNNLLFKINIYIILQV